VAENLQRVGVVIVNYNSGELLARCLAGLASQTRLPDRVVVVDNASEDDSEQAAQRPIMDSMNKNHSSSSKFYQSIELLKLEQNVGFARANNIAVELLHDIDWVVTLNPDAVAATDCLQILLETSSNKPDFKFFGCRMLSENPQVLDGVGDVYHTSGLVWREGHGNSIRDENYRDGEIFSPCAAAAMYLRRCWLQAGGLDERYFCYVEDIDLGFRLRLLGYRCLYVADAEVLHTGSAVSGSHSDFTVYHGHRNLVWTYIKNMPGLLFWLYLPQHLLLNLVTMAGFCLRGQIRPVLRAKGDALRRLPEFWRDRRRIQSLRQVDSREIRRALATGLKPLLHRRYRYEHANSNGSAEQR